ncbi:protein DpdH [Mycolicibacterium sp. CR10]|uniref:protein DpdH n=1 Tax=Mycolicibacterium sp. CR10 TaxID=2562314 RepID=UPI0010C06434|nr:protein DpdH [Mycolicibacterium sp. CR10]
MTETFQNFVCWDDAAVLAVTPRDAASLTDARFQAIHHPLRLHVRRIDARDGEQWATEADVLTALRGELRSDGYLFIPVVGGSGTGKSHLVRWVKDQTEGEPDWEVRYLPKNRTGLRRAIEIIIRDLKGPQIDEAREALESAPAYTESDEVLAQRLLDELALLIGDLDQLQSEPPKDARTTQLRQKVSRELPDLLRDPVVRRKLVADGAVVQRLVGLALRGRAEGDGLDDDATHFLASDFPLSFEEIGDATTGAKKLLSQLAAMPPLIDTAVAMINEALPEAEKRIAVSTQVDLVEVFREVRRALFNDGKQLALFVEDLTVLHGVEREFLDAIVEPVHSSDGDMCSLRMIFAVTEGHFDDLDTVKTRCDDAYWLDAPYGEDGVEQQEAVSFVARYFNAARLDPKEIDTAWAARSKDHDNWLRNACKTCPQQVVCHETFGASREGYGLYPLNVAAAGRFVRALSTERFDPRDIVRDVISRLLRQGSADMRQDKFPSASTVSPFDQNTTPLAPLIKDTVRRLRPIDSDRVSNVLQYWSDENSPADVKGAVLEAFGVGDFAGELPALRSLDDPDVDPIDTSEKKERRRSAVEERLKPEPRKQFAELARWSSSQGELSAKTFRELRKLIHATIQQNLEFGSNPVNLGSEFDTFCLRETDIVIKGTVTQQTVHNPVVVVDRDAASALQALILAKELGSEDWPQAAVFRRTLGAAIEKWTTAVTVRLTRPTTQSTEAAVVGTIVASAVTGDLSRAATPADYVSALFSVAPAATVPPERSPKWTALVAKAFDVKTRSQKQIQAEFGEARGKGGGIRMVQADRLLPIVKGFAATWELDSSDPAMATFLRTVTPVVDDEWEALQARVIAAQPLIDPERQRSWADQTAKILTVLTVAHQGGRLTDGNAVEELTKLAGRDPERVLRSFADAADLLTRDATLQEKIALLASDAPVHVAVVHDFAVRAAAAIQSVERDLATRQTQAGGANDMEKAVTRVLEATGRFDASVKGLVR